MKLRLYTFALLFAAGLWQTTPAKAALIFTLTPPAQTGTAGGLLAFVGTLFNSGAADVFLNGTSAAVPAALTLDEEPFFLNTPLFLAPGGEFSGELFDVAIAANAAPATYVGSFTIRGGADSNALNALASGAFSVTVGGVTAIPEPNAAILLATALAIGGIVRGRWPARSRLMP